MVRLKSEDRTIERNYIQKWQFLVKEYEKIKEGTHPRFRFVGEFYKHHGTDRQTFAKYYNRYKQRGRDVRAFMPCKRGPKWQERRLPYIDHKIIETRQKGLNRYEIEAALKPKLRHHLPSPSTIYRICHKHGLGRLTPVMKERKRKIIKERPGELGHIDCHYLKEGLLKQAPKQRYYLVCVVDSCSRIVWAEVLQDIKSLSVMFGALQCFNAIRSLYDFRFEEVITDNGAEFASKTNTDHHPFERMLKEMGVKHRYTRPYRPQTNGKAERFWRTLNEDLIEGTDFESLEAFKEELANYLVYYNEFRPHSSLAGKSPLQFIQNLSANY